jgi:hypothetical protein
MLILQHVRSSRDADSCNHPNGKYQLSGQHRSVWAWLSEPGSASTGVAQGSGLPWLGRSAGLETLGQSTAH